MNIQINKVPTALCVVDNDQIRALVDTIADIYRVKLGPSNATGNLSNFQTIIDINDTTFSVAFELEDYWKYVEYGRGPGKQPPIDAIEQWVRIKPVVPRAINGRVPDTRQLAFLIARKIGREGIEPKHYLRDTMYSEEVNIIINALKRTLTEQIIKSISED